MSNHTLLVFSIGPVQSFIASARKIEDLWSGSYILSFLTEKAIEAALSTKREINVEMIFPNVDKDVLAQLEREDVEVASLPNRFMCRLGSRDGTRLKDEEIIEFVMEIEEKVRKAFSDLCQFAMEYVFTDEQINEIQKVAEEQINSLLEIFWAFEHESENYNASREKLEKKLASVKNNRQYPLNMQQGLVCTVCNQRESLHTHSDVESANYMKMKAISEKLWKNLKSWDEGIIKDGERLCSVCLSKRLARRYFKKIRKAPKGRLDSFESIQVIAEPYDYYAIIMMDGDNMGKWLSGAEGNKLEGTENIDIHYHKEVSRRLSHFSRKIVPSIVQHEKYKGRLIYAGGDDVLAYVSLEHVLEIASKLREAFGNKDTGLDNRATASIGIVVAHKKAPFQMVLETARKLEKRAKDYRSHEKNAFSLGVYTRNGEVREVTLPWTISTNQLPYKRGSDQCLVTKLEAIIKNLIEELSNTFVQKYGQTFLPLIGADILTNKKPLLSKAIKTQYTEEDRLRDERLIHTEITRLVKRSTISKKANPEKIASTINELYNISGSLLENVHLLEILRFFRNKELSQMEGGK